MFGLQAKRPLANATLTWIDSRMQMLINDHPDPLGTISARSRLGQIKIKDQLSLINDIGMRILMGRKLISAERSPESYIILHEFSRRLDYPSAHREIVDGTPHVNA